MGTHNGHQLSDWTQWRAKRTGHTTNVTGAVPPGLCHHRKGVWRSREEVWWARGVGGSNSDWQRAMWKSRVEYKYKRTATRKGVCGGGQADARGVIGSGRVPE